MSFVEEFKAFAMRGNVVDLAVGVVIGGAFGKIVGSLVNDVIMPPLKLLTGGINFNSLALTYSKQEQVMKEGKPVLDDAGQPIMQTMDVPYLGYGAFIQSVFDFLLIALAIFCVIKLMNSVKKKEEAAPAAPPAPPEDVLLLREIRDALRK